ncbi:isocitrate lyase/phosphoenolpyruvate mutase family protein [Thalassobius sp. Cn5-15]|uniref:isocitrate lyase/PEP mutase family protein n=1 Tax=Thalassobius sp. Cn5-15 TaxID=2917763 RepID=UPI001EF364EC|nr:isocitrate lyase/phosphoenolpyruvate mutase family protein [Thalassobius sp. Cn5-15]MCG7492708.1 isocitrate lyase/phosphoenolpyruvate mutase family protein [Thalassobius sp. Cn5-15]
MSQIEKATRFKQLHQKGAPVVLYNIWDAGGALAVAEAGASAIATGSWSIAAAHGYPDGEMIPLDLALQVVERICATVDLPVTVDFEGGYATATAAVAENIRKVIRTGAVGINFEDRIVNGKGLHTIDAQVARIQAIRDVATEEGVPLFINARTDLFLNAKPDNHPDLLAEALERETAYAAAGADGFFVPGLTDEGLITQITQTARLPVNVMMRGALKTVAEAAKTGAARASYGPAPYVRFLSDLKTAYAEAINPT